MNIAKEHKAINAALDDYRRQLKVIPDELFAKAYAEGHWSYAEVYSHVLQALLMASVTLERCAYIPEKPNGPKINLAGRLVMLFGRLPPVKIKVPESVAARIPATKITKEEAKNLIIKCCNRVDAITELVKQASPNTRTKHPRLGMFNAKEWYKFIRIHLEHHLKQLKRIDKAYTSHQTINI